MEDLITKYLKKIKKEHENINSNLINIHNEMDTLEESLVVFEYKYFLKRMNNVNYKKQELEERICLIELAELTNKKCLEIDESDYLYEEYMKLLNIVIEIDSDMARLEKNAEVLKYKNLIEKSSLLSLKRRNLEMSIRCLNNSYSNSKSLQNNKKVDNSFKMTRAMQG